MISVQNVGYRVGQFALSGISFEIPTGQYGILMGRTGCGKTTILEIICGLKRATAGKVLLDGRDVTDCKAANRGIGYVPQDLALFPSMTVFDHIAFALRIRKWKPDEIEHRVKELADLLGIGYLLKRRPQGLSGGESQRVALGRALSFKPGVLCLDEPLGALDEDTLADMFALLRRVQHETGVTVLHVTHSRTEADALADIKLKMVDGRVESGPSTNGASQQDVKSEPNGGAAAPAPTGERYD